jgi:hypothetical protein
MQSPVSNLIDIHWGFSEFKHTYGDTASHYTWNVRRPCKECMNNAHRQWSDDRVPKHDTRRKKLGFCDMLTEVAVFEAGCYFCNCSVCWFTRQILLLNSNVYLSAVRSYWEISENLLFQTSAVYLLINFVSQFENLEQKLSASITAEWGSNSDFRVASSRHRLLFFRVSNALLCVALTTSE